MLQHCFAKVLHDNFFFTLELSSNWSL